MLKPNARCIVDVLSGVGFVGKSNRSSVAALVGNAVTIDHYNRAQSDAELRGRGQLVIGLYSPVTKQFLTFVAQKAANHGYRMIALLEDEPAGNKACSPLELFGSALSTVSGDVLL